MSTGMLLVLTQFPDRQVLDALQSAAEQTRDAHRLALYVCLCVSLGPVHVCAPRRAALI